MKRLIRVGTREPIVLVAWAAALLLPSPALANNPDFQGLRYLFFLWPVGALLTLLLLALAVTVRRVQPPVRGLSRALIGLSALVLLGWPYLVYEKGFGLDPRYRLDNLIAVLPALGAALFALVSAWRALRGPAGPD